MVQQRSAAIIRVLACPRQETQPSLILLLVRPPYRLPLEICVAEYLDLLDELADLHDGVELEDPGATTTSA
jgi:hypothetical protein